MDGIISSILGDLSQSKWGRILLGLLLLCIIGAIGYFNITR